MIYAIALILLALSGVFDPAAAAGCDPALAALFSPARPRLGSYEVCVTSDPPETALGREGFTDAGPERLEVLDAMGAAGGFDRARMNQLYDGRRVEVRRGWRIAKDRFESITAISPYPDASLTTLHEGTLTIRWTVPSHG
jgi:hypothetical protein